MVSVTTTYTGAAPEIIDTDITEVIEGAVAGIAGVKVDRIPRASAAAAGRSIEFETGRNIDEAANDVRDAVARVRAELPDEVDEPQITKNNSDSDPVMRIAVTSDRLTPAEITDYVERSSSTGWRRSTASPRSRSSASGATRCGSGSTAGRWRRAI